MGSTDGSTTARYTANGPPCGPSGIQSDGTEELVRGGTICAKHELTGATLPAAGRVILNESYRVNATVSTDTSSQSVSQAKHDQDSQATETGREGSNRGHVRWSW